MVTTLERERDIKVKEEERRKKQEEQRLRQLQENDENFDFEDDFNEQITDVKKTPWKEVESPEGEKYFFRYVITKETVWDLPPDDGKYLLKQFKWSRCGPTIRLGCPNHGGW